MPGTHEPCPPEFRRRMVELAREFEPSAGVIRNWVKQADLDEGRRSPTLPSRPRRAFGFAIPRSVMVFPDRVPA